LFIKANMSVYTHPNDNSQGHAEYVLGLMGPQHAEDPPSRHRPKKEKYTFYMNPLFGGINWELGGEYIPRRGNDRIMVWVSCRPECPDCDGSSPGCGGEKFRIVRRNNIETHLRTDLYTNLRNEQFEHIRNGTKQPLWVCIKNDD